MNKLIVIFFLTISIFIQGANAIEDEFVLDLKPQEEIKKINYNFEDTKRIQIDIKILNPIKSEKELYESQKIDFIIDNNIFYKKKLLVKKGTKAQASVNTIITAGMNGIPASVILSDFKIENLKDENLSPSLEIFGQDRSLLVFPLKWVLTILPPTGSLTNFIKGGKLKIKANKIYTIYYYPEWS